jgi:NAD dependent epimerase/dehydratase family enzyme
MSIVFWRMSSILLEGSRVSAEKIQAAGYRFRFPALGSALEHLL